MVVKILIGDNPFLGISHLEREKGRETLKSLTLEKKMEILISALESGAHGFTFSTHPYNLDLLIYIRDTEKALLKKLDFYILTPYAAEYVRLTDTMGTNNLVKTIFLRGLKMSPLHLLRRLPYSVISLFLYENLKPYLDILPKNNVKAILLHEVLSEPLIAFELSNVIKELKIFFSKEHLSFGLETRNISHLDNYFKRCEESVDYVMTPMNPLGYQMGIKEEAEKAIKNLSNKGLKIIAMNILASGASKIEDSASYLRRFQRNLYAVAFGTSKPERARTNVLVLNKYLNQ